MDMSKLFDVVYWNMHTQLERYGIKHGHTEQTCVATVMDMLLATMRHNDSYKKHKIQNNSKEVQSSEAVEENRVVEDPVIDEQPEEPEIIYIPAGAESEDDDIQLLD